MLSVNIRYHEVHRTADGNQVGYLPAPAHGVHGMHQRQARAPVMQTVRHLVPPADEEHAELATTGLDGSRKHAFGQFEDGLRLHPELPFGHVVYQLFYDPAGFHDFVHAHHIAVKRITMGIGDFLEVHLAVHRVGMVLAHVVGPSAGTARTAGTAQRDGILTRKQADPLQTGAGNDALRKDVVVFMDNVPQVHDKLFRLPHEIGKKKQKRFLLKIKKKKTKKKLKKKQKQQEKNK